LDVLILDDASPDQLAYAAGENLAAHMSWVQMGTAGMSVQTDDQLVVVDAGLPTDTFNTVCRARLAPEQLAARIAQVVAHFRQVERPFSWWVGPADQPDTLDLALLGAGLVAAESELAMAADLASLAAAVPVPKGFRIKRAVAARQIHEFAAVLAAPAYPAVLDFYAAATPRLLAPGAPLWLYVGYLGAEPVASAELTVGGGVVGLYNIVTLAAHRRQGIGSAMTLRPLLDARQQGYKTAILQASAEGQGVYARLGFRAFGEYTEYQPPAA
jgi:GNAT superfamily N-acetyltransferase